MLEPRGNVDGSAHGVVLLRDVGQQCPDDDLSGVDADANRRRVLDFPNVLDHGQRRTAGPDRMILLRNRRTEQRHDAVALQLVDRPFKAGHRFAHRRCYDAELTIGLFRIEIVDEGG